MTKSSGNGRKRTLRGGAGDAMLWSRLSAYKLLDYLCWPQSMYFRKVQIKALTTSSWIFQTSIFPCKILLWLWGNYSVYIIQYIVICIVGGVGNKVNKVSAQASKSRLSQCFISSWAKHGIAKNCLPKRNMYPLDVFRLSTFAHADNIYLSFGVYMIPEGLRVAVSKAKYGSNRHKVTSVKTFNTRWIGREAKPAVKRKPYCE